MKTIGDIDNFYREGFIIKSVLLILIYPILFMVILSGVIITNQDLIV